MEGNDVTGIALTFNTTPLTRCNSIEHVCVFSHNAVIGCLVGVASESVLTSIKLMPVVSISRFTLI